MRRIDDVGDVGHGQPEQAGPLVEDRPGRGAGVRGGDEVREGLRPHAVLACGGEHPGGADGVAQGIAAEQVAGRRSQVADRTVAVGGPVHRTVDRPGHADELAGVEVQRRRQAPVIESGAGSGSGSVRARGLERGGGQLGGGHRRHVGCGEGRESEAVGKHPDQVRLAPTVRPRRHGAVGADVAGQGGAGGAQWARQAGAQAVDARDDRVDGLVRGELVQRQVQVRFAQHAADGVEDGDVRDLQPHVRPDVQPRGLRRGQRRARAARRRAGDQVGALLHQAGVNESRDAARDRRLRQSRRRRQLRARHRPLQADLMVEAGGGGRRQAERRRRRDGQRPVRRLRDGGGGGAGCGRGSIRAAAGGAARGFDRGAIRASVPGRRAGSREARRRSGRPGDGRGRGVGRAVGEGRRSGA